MKKVVILVVLTLFILTGCSVKKVEEITDSEKFSNQFGIKEKNSFVYSNMKEILTLVSSDNAIIYLADPDDDWSREGASILKSTLRDKDSNIIYYYNPKKQAEGNTKSYHKLTLLLGDIAKEDVNGTKFIPLPTIILIKDGSIVGYDSSMSKITVDAKEYLTKNKRKKIINKLSSLMDSVYYEYTNS